jgi:competence protein CoiA
MLYAENEFGEKHVAQPDSMGVCPTCRQLLIPKCGQIKIWHWSHKRRSDCDPWFEPETRWHLDWKAQVSPGNVEVNFGDHRADLVAIDGTVIELQHSQISPAEIQIRESFYGDMIWILDGSVFEDHLVFRDKGTYYSFRWKWPRKCWEFAKQPVFFDLGKGSLFEIKKMHPSKPSRFVEGYSLSRKPCAGWGRFIRKSDFMGMYFRKLLKTGT